MFDASFTDYPGKGDRHLYVIIDTFGKCWMIVEGETKKIDGLPSLLRAGWKPVRECPFSGTSSGTPYILILLERV